MKKILLYNSEGSGTAIEEAFLQKKGCTDYQIIRIDGNKPALFMKEAADADGIIAVYTPLNAKHFKLMPKCRVIAIQAIGFDKIDYKKAAEYNITVCNIPDYCIEEVAIHSLALILDCSRRICRFDRAVRNGSWQVTDGGKIFRSSNHTLGIISFGKTARHLAELIKPLRMKIIAFDPYLSDDIFTSLGVTRANSLDDLLAESHYISINAPLLPSTRNMLSAEQFSKMRDGVCLISTGRGGIINENDLKNAILSGKVAAAALDVITDEVTPYSTLFNMEEVTITPHVAYYSEDSCNEVREKAIQQIIDVLWHQKTPAYKIN